MGGFFGTISHKDCKYDVFFGTDYHSHLGTRRGGLALVAARTEAKKAKNWAEADRIRDELKARGIEIIDTPQGAKWRKV